MSSLLAVPNATFLPGSVTQCSNHPLQLTSPKPSGMYTGARAGYTPIVVPHVHCENKVR